MAALERNNTNVGGWYKHEPGAGATGDPGHRLAGSTVSRVCKRSARCR